MSPILPLGIVIWAAPPDSLTVWSDLHTTSPSHLFRGMPTATWTAMIWGSSVTDLSVVISSVVPERSSFTLYLTFLHSAEYTSTASPLEGMSSSPTLYMAKMLRHFFTDFPMGILMSFSSWYSSRLTGRISAFTSLRSLTSLLDMTT